MCYSSEMARITPYFSIHVTEVARSELRSATVAFTSDAGRRLSQSEVLIAACRVAGNHRDEMLEELAKGVGHD